MGIFMGTATNSNHNTLSGTYKLHVHAQATATTGGILQLQQDYHTYWNCPR